MADNKLTTPQIIVNNIPINYVPNTLKYTPGFGEYKLDVSAVGPGESERIFSENAEDKKSKVMFDLYPTAANIDLVREWKVAKASNVVQVVADDIQRSFTSATLINDYEVELQADGKISLEWHADPAS